MTAAEHPAEDDGLLAAAGRIALERARLFIAGRRGPAPAASARPTPVIAEPTIRGFEGHYAEMALRLAAGFRALGYRPALLVHRRCDRAFLEAARREGFPVEAVFRRSFHRTFRERRPAALSLAADALVYAVDVERGLARLGRPRPALLYFPTSNLAMLLGATERRRRFTGRGEGERQVHTFLHDPGDPQLGRGCHGPTTHAAAFARLAPRLAEGALRIASDSGGVARALEALGARDALEVPMATNARPPGPGAEERPSRPPLVGFVGGLRAEKGGHLLPALLERLFAARPDARAAAQAYAPPSDALAQEALRRLRALAATPAGGRLELLETPLSAADFKAFFERIDVLLMPYDVDAYRTRTSGPCVEALSAGRVIVGPHEGFLRDKSRGYRGYVAADPRDGAAFAAAAIDAVDRFAALAPLARADAWGFARENSSEGLAARILGIEVGGGVAAIRAGPAATAGLPGVAAAPGPAGAGAT